LSVEDADASGADEETEMISTMPHSHCLRVSATMPAITRITARIQSRKAMLDLTESLTQRQFR